MNLLLWPMLQTRQFEAEVKVQLSNLIKNRIFNAYCDYAEQLLYAGDLMLVIRSKEVIRVFT